MKEMVGGCCVCSDERGWPDNPLVYCDGNGCNVAVHQACYGIVTVPTGPWYCRKCESTDKQPQKCELCPARSGALKRTDNGGWAHVVCALYIPEVRFGNVTSMEPIILQLIPPERFNKTCYICQEACKISRSTVGACMQCNKSGCKQQFHVTCAQSLGLLCEEAGNYLDNVKYCGYCRHHYGKLKKGGNVKTIPPYKPVSQDSPSSDSGPEKEVDTPTQATANPDAPVVATTSAASRPSNSKSSSGRKSGQGGSSATKTTGSSETPTPPITLKLTTPQSKSTPSSKVSTPQAKSTEKAQSKKSPPHNETQKRASSSTTEAVASNPSAIPAVSPVSGSGGQQSTKTKSSSVSPSTSKIPPNQQEPIVVINGIRVSSPASSSTSTAVTHSQPSSGQKYSSPTISESVITNTNDSSFNTPANSTSETKQTKKRKAVSQATSVAYTPTTLTSTIQTSNVPDQLMQWQPSATQSSDVLAEPSEDKTKKMRTEGTHVMPAVITKPSSASSNGGSNSNNSTSNNSGSVSSNSSNVITPMEEVASSQQVPYSTTSQSPAQPIMTPSQTPVISSDKHSSRMPSPALPPPATSNASTPSIRSNASNVQQQQNHKYPNMAPVRPEEHQSSLVVSVPLSQANPPAAHSLHPKPSTSTTTLSEGVFVEPATPPVSSSWGLRVAYEPQVGQQAHVDQSEDHRRSRAESLEIAKQTVIHVDEKSLPGPSGIRNKKRSPIPAPQMQMPAPTPSTSGTSAYHPQPQGSPMSRGVVKRSSTPVVHMPSTSSGPMAVPSTSNQPHEITDSPPNSPGTTRAIKANLDRMGRAPHMLGNELNPESPAAARLSEQLNAELVAHSVFRAPSPVVGPPLINKVNSGRQSANATSGGPQSLDQLLERQWEQGSQFLMEQAQHFDIASLLSCLHQLRTENVRLEEHVNTLVQRRDHLLAVNARLAIPFSAGMPDAVAPPPPPPQRSHSSSGVRQSRSSVDGMVDARNQQLLREPQTKSS